MESKLSQIKLTGKWFRQYIVIMSFYFFDYLSTIYNIQKPSQEWNRIARFLMIYFDSTFIGMTLFFFGLALGYYAIHIWWSGKIEITKQETGKELNMLLKINFIGSSFICSSEFGFAATSWFWRFPVFYKMLLGFLLYYLIDKYWISNTMLKP
ncbi:hypothetical protein E4H04_12575 [Candidatus Bathyarchaeota archaeon]|nr:MAG: hypothetical protein E4H04_12575 [Candidatus Bathyarchaeota archaeon]